MEESSQNGRGMDQDKVAGVGELPASVKDE
jgi:hypothetical protein